MANICLYIPTLGSYENEFFFRRTCILLNCEENILSKPYDLKISQRLKIVFSHTAHQQTNFLIFDFGTGFICNKKSYSQKVVSRCASARNKEKRYAILLL